MAEPYMGQISIVAFNFAPRGWALCNGQLQPIQQNVALFSLLGTTYGGNGITTFGVPDLRSRIPMKFGNSHSVGERGGTETVTLISAQLPSHNHTVSCSSASGTSNTASGNFIAGVSGGLNKPPLLAFSSSNNATLNSGAISATGGGSQPHTNIQPCLTLNFIIATQGIFPSRN